MADKIFHADDLVWAKMPNYPHWPGIIVASDDDMIETCGPLDPKKGEHYVYFFGTENYAPIPIKYILPHSQEMFDKHDKKKRISKDLRVAIDAMKEYCLSSGALDLHSKELVSNDEDPSRDMMSKVKVVTEHSIDNSDLSCELEVELFTAESEINYVCSEPLTSNVVGPTTPKAVTAEPEISESCELWTTDVVAKPAIDISIESCCESTTPKVVTTERNIEDLCAEQLTPKVVTENSDDLCCEKTMSKVKLVTADSEINDVCSKPLTSKVVAKKAIDIGIKSSSAPTTLKVVTAEAEIGRSCEPLSPEVVAKQAINISIESGCEPTTSKVVTTEDLCCEPFTAKVVKRAVDSGNEPKMPQVKRLCSTLAESPEVQYEEPFLPQSRRIGFLGLGELGVKLVRKLIETDHDVTVYDKNLVKFNYSNIMGAKVANSILDICDKCELIFCCADAFCMQELFLFDEFGTLTGLQKTKNKYLRGYIEMTPMDETQLIMTAEAVTFAGVPFLEVPVSAPCFLANGELNVFAAGDKNVFIDCLPIFCKVFNVEATYIGNKIGQALAADQMFNALNSTLCSAFQEALNFATTVNKIPRDDFRELLDLCEMNSSLITRQMDAVEEKIFRSTYSLDYLQQDTQRVLTIGNQVCHSMPIVAQSFNSFIHARSNFQL